MQELLNATIPVALSALVSLAWKYLAGKKAEQHAARVKEIARAAWALAKSDSDGDYLHRARTHAKEMLAKLKIPETYYEWLEHELGLLVAEDLAHDQREAVKLIATEKAMRAAGAHYLENVGKTFDDAMERGQARIDAENAPVAVILCPEPSCVLETGHDGPHKTNVVSGSFETQTEPRS